MRKTKTKTVSPNNREEVAQWVEAIYPNLHAGVTWIIDTTEIHYESALDEMKGIFDSADLDIILETMRTATNYMYGPIHMSGQSLSMLIPNNTDTGKELAMLTRFQRATLELWACHFWLKHAEDERDNYKARLL
jgi:hypothetical protein